MSETHQYIGDLARQTGTSTKTIRYYEDLGLLDPPARSASGYRIYGPAHRERLRFITHAKALGFTLEQIGGLVDLLRSGSSPCGQVQQMLHDKLEQLDATLRSLSSYRDHLRQFITVMDQEPDQPGVPCRHVANFADWLARLPPPEGSALEVAARPRDDACAQVDHPCHDPTAERPGSRKG